MSFYFNWAHLDETAAEAIRILINDKLKQIFDDRLNVLNTSDSCETTKSNNTCISKLGGVNSAFEGNRFRGKGFNMDAKHVGSGARVGLTRPSVVVNPNAQLHLTSMDPACHRAASLSVDSATNSEFKHQAPQRFSHRVNQGISGPSSAPATTTTAGGGGVALHTPAPPKKIPLISFLHIDSIKWGTTPPFIEIERFENALDVFDAAVPATSLNMAGPSPVGAVPEHFLGDSLDSLEVSPLGAQKETVQRGKVLAPVGRAADTGLMTAVAQEAVDHGSNVTAIWLTEEGRAPSGKGLGMCHLRGAKPTSPQGRSTITIFPNKVKTPYKYNDQEFSTPLSTPTDTLAPFLGAGGLHIRLHLTYGGSMSFSASTAMQYCVNIGSFSLPVYMPIELCVSGFDLDCFVCFNFHHNECRLWLEPGKLSDSAINRLKVVAVFGERKDSDDDLDMSPTELLSNKLSRADDDDGSIFVDRREVEQLIVREVKTVLQEKLMLPHFVSIPIHISG